MKKWSLSQEVLKSIACVTMLLDHVGVALVLPLTRAATWEQADTFIWAYYILRMIGRIAFPIYCFLLAEGADHTGNPEKYAARLAVGALLSEIPFDLAFWGRISWEHNNVMVTLLLGFVMIQAMKRSEGIRKLLWIIPFYFTAELLHSDYGGTGILIISIFWMTRGLRREKLLQLAGFYALFCLEGTRWYVGSVGLPVQQCALLALIPIFCYSGRKLTRSRAVQWGFYLFYPVHMLVLYLIMSQM